MKTYLFISILSVLSDKLHVFFWGPTDFPLVKGEFVTIAALIAAAIGAAVSTGMAIHNSQVTKSAHNEAKRTLGNLNTENTNDYYRDYYRSALDNDATRAYFKRLSDSIDKNNKALDNSVVSSGATQENQLAAKQAKNEVMSNTMDNIVANEDARKQATQNNYFNRKTTLTQSQLAENQNYANQKVANNTDLAEGIGQAAQTAAMAWAPGVGGTNTAINRGTVATGPNYAGLNETIKNDALKTARAGITPIKSYTAR